MWLQTNQTIMPLSRYQAKIGQNAGDLKIISNSGCLLLLFVTQQI